MHYLKHFLLALQFLTRLPTKNYTEVSAVEVGSSVLFFPLVGLIIGSLLVGVAWTFANLSASILALIILILSVLLTGALHLDGLADSADGWLSGGDKQRSLEVIKDPSVGTAGVVIVVLTLLSKCIVLVELIANNY